MLKTGLKDQPIPAVPNCLAKTYFLVFRMLLASVGAAFLLSISGIGAGALFFLLLGFLLLFVIGGLDGSKRWHSTVLVVFAMTTAGPLFSLIPTEINGNATTPILILAASITTLLFFGLSLVALMSKAGTFSSMDTHLFAVLWVVFGGSVMALILKQFGYDVSGFQLLLSIVSSFLFCGFILSDTQGIIEGTIPNPYQGAIALFLNILNLFLDLLNILFNIFFDD